MSDLHVAFVSKSFLRSHWDLEYRAWRDSDNEKALNDRLALWAKRTDLKETSAESAFIDVFFRETWGYVQTGQRGSETGFSLYPKFAIPGAGANGGSGEADLAIGYFSKTAPGQIPQVLCEFKAIRSALDADQKRKGNTRSPVRQCLEYLGFARRGMIGSEPNLPTWGIVTDMNEFRLYWYDRGHQQSLRFTIQPRDLFQGTGLLAENEEARFDRFLFQKVFHRETLLTPGGKCLLLSLIGQQRFRDRKLENAFYAEYRNFRERLYGTLLEKNPEGTPRFPGTKGRLVRLAQKILDRCIFIFFCEDMRQALAFPPQLLRNFLIERSNDPYYDAEATTIWQDLLRLFHAMNEGKAFGGKALNQFNGGLFAPDADLEKLHVPNSIFCQHMQGQNEASLYTFKETVLYLCASYNFVGGWAQGLSRPPVADGSTGERDHLKSVGLYTLGRIFEQSITELEIREAEVDGRPSINKESKRKRDGVYYTPEWVVERIVDETLRPRLHEIKRECGWPSNKLPKKEALDAFIARLKTLTVVDPACGSGAFLITTLRYLLDTWHAVREQRKSVTGEIMTEDDAGLVRDILKSNVYGVDTNSASAEIARLALWLHTARGDKPLSSLDTTIREGNSLISSDFFKGQINLAFYGEVEKERINAFDWEKAFPEVFERGGFDAVVGNPPYVKLQNFRKVHDDMAEFLRSGRQDIPGYTSTQSGNFDLYLPFIEKGLSILNEHGRLGFIAPSLWTVNEYGAALRAMIADGQNLDRWLDFKAHQIFEESTVYTALQFYTKQPNDAVKVAFAPNGVVAGDPWSGMECRVAYDNLDYGDRWLLLAGRERALIDRLSATCRRLDDPTVTTNIYQGLITSADAIYHLDRRGPRRYLCSPRGKGAPLAYEVEIEDEVMQPLVSGADSRRYIEPPDDLHFVPLRARHRNDAPYRYWNIPADPSACLEVSLFLRRRIESAGSYS
jgi:Eco57I restriction-modification methylase